MKAQSRAGARACGDLCSADASITIVASADFHMNAPEYQPGFEDADTSLAAAVPFYGLYDLTNANGFYYDGQNTPGFKLLSQLAEVAPNDPSPVRRGHPTTHHASATTNPWR